MDNSSSHNQHLSKLSNGTSTSFIQATPSFRDKRKDYHQQKKKVTRDLFTVLDDIDEIRSGWLKVRVSLKRWTKLWFLLKPGFLMIFSCEDPIKKNRIGIISLKICQIIERPTKKDGFCFKIFSPLGNSIWLRGSSLNLVLPQASLIIRATDEEIGRGWMEAMKKSNLSADLNASQLNKTDYAASDTSGSALNNNNNLSLTDMNDESSEGLYENNTNLKDQDGTTQSIDSEDSNLHECADGSINGMKISAIQLWKDLKLEAVRYVLDGAEELGTAGQQTENVPEGNKNFLWHILKQVRPGMDLSKVTLPTFILEPRSFLEKLADYYYHCDILSEAVSIDDPLLRLINIVKWYLSGFYKKPKGPKKPYNPILGERFRCYWEQPKTSSRTFYVAEQVSHHPPISAYHVTNRKDGYCLTSALLTKSKYNGNSVSAILDGKAKLYLMKRDETYTITMPYAHCRGIILGSLCFELGGKVEISCPDTGCGCELDFKLATMWSGSDSYNTLTGKIYQGNKTTHTLDGHWDKKIHITNKATDERSTLWEVTDTIRNSRLKRYTVSVKDQNQKESVKLWSKVTEALNNGDQTVATAEKTVLEEAQRRDAREREGSWDPDLFTFDAFTKEWRYKHLDDRAWNENTDIYQFERDFRVKTLTQNKTTRYDSAYDVLVNQIERHRCMRSVDSATSSRLSLNNNDLGNLDKIDETSYTGDDVLGSVESSQTFHETAPSSKKEVFRDLKLEVKQLTEKLQSLTADQRVLEKKLSSRGSIFNSRYTVMIVILVIAIAVYQFYFSSFMQR